MVLVNSSLYERQQSELLRLLIESAEDYAIFMLDTEGRIATWNLGAQRILGYGERDVLRRHVTLLYTPEDQDAGVVQNELEQARQSGLQEHSRWHVRAGGERFWARGTVRPIYDEGRELIGYAKVMRDATEAKRAEDALRAAHSQTMEILESISDAFYAVDHNFNFTFVNRKATEWWGCSRAELIGRNIWTVFPEMVSSESYHKHLQAMAEGKQIHFETISRIINRWIEITIYPGHTGLSVYFREIGERKRREHQVGVALEKQSRIAEALQRSMLMTGLETRFPRLSVETLYEPALDEADVGGDFLDAFALRDGRIVLLVGDVSGKGLRAASRTAEVKYALRAFSHQTEAPHAVLEELNNFICFSHQRDRDTIFITLSMVVIDPDAHTITASVAGSDPPMILRADGTVQEIPGQGMAIGVIEETRYESASLPFEKGDTVLLATDGITEARQGREFLGNEGMAKIAIELGPKIPVLELIKGIYRASCSFAGGVQRDDACVLGGRLQ